MESVSPILDSSTRWDLDIQAFWRVLREMFEVEKSDCGTHIHIAPMGRRYTLKEAKTIAFACCYYERYIISCLPEERRDHDYCRRNTRVATKMGQLYEARTSKALVQIASDLNTLSMFEDLVTYMQGSTHGDRRVLWNFHNLCYGSKGTIEFRGGRHLRGPIRSVAWITFAQVFILMALDEVSH
jgi:hypothetical protein